MRDEKVTDEEGGVKAPPVDKWKMPDSFKVADLQKILADCGAPPITDTLNSRWIAQTVSFWIERLINPHVVSPEFRPVMKRFDNFKKAWAVMERGLRDMAASRRVQASKLRAQGFPHLIELADDKENEALQFEKLTAMLSETKHFCILIDRKKKGEHGSSTLPYNEELIHTFMRLGWAWEEAGCAPATASMRYRIIEMILNRHIPGGAMATADAICKAIAKLRKQRPELMTPEPYDYGTK